MNQEQWDDLMSGLATGKSLEKLVEEVGIPLKIVWKSLRADEELMRQYLLACQLKALVVFEQVLEIADSKEIKGFDKDVMIRTRLKVAEKYLPKLFGDVTKVEHSGNMTLTQQSDAQIDARIAGLLAKTVVTH